MKFIIIVLSLVVFGVSRAECQTDSIANPKSVLDSPVEYSGWRENSKNATRTNAFRIGLFFPSDSLNSLSQSLFNAAYLAIDEINSYQEDNAVIHKLVNRWSSDPWSGGAKEMIKLVYTDSVLAVVGSIDGDATHIAEQITTKARLSLLSPISADQTLTYIRIPWIFRLPPSYRAQAEVIVNQGVKANNVKKIGIITENNHDGRTFGDELNKVLSVNHIYPLFHLEVSNSDLNFHSLIQRLISFNPHSIIICLSKDNIIKLLSELANNIKNIDVMMPWIPGFEYTSLDDYIDGNIFYVEPFSRTSGLLFKDFANKYRNVYNSNPTFGAAYTYDVIKIVFHAMQKSGPNRAILRDAIAGMSGYEGVTGTIIWDNGGGNIAKPVLRSKKKR